MFELCCGECGEVLLGTGPNEKDPVTGFDAALHAVMAHRLPSVEVAWAWTAQTACRAPRYQQCSVPRCHRPGELHPTPAECEDARLRLEQLADPELAESAGIGADASVIEGGGPRARRAAQRVEAERVASGGHWSLPYVRVKPTEWPLTLEVVR